MKKKHKQKKPILEKAFVAWLKYDPFVSIIVRKDDVSRRNVMLNLLGKDAAQRHFGKFPTKKPKYGPIYPETVRIAVNESIQDAQKRDELITKLIFWATDSEINNIYIKSHLTRIQIITSLLGPIFFHATAKQEKNLLKGIKFMLVKKQTSIGLHGEQSYYVHEVLLNRIGDILVHNQKVIINKAVREAEEKMRVHLLRQIQELRGEKHTSSIYNLDLKTKINRIVKEKFPLKKESTKHLEEMLKFYTKCQWPELQAKAIASQNKVLEIRKPLTLTSPDLKS